MSLLYRNVSETVKSAGLPMFEHRHIRCDMRLCRKIHGSWLHQKCGIASEVIDFLQGRTNPSVFSRHYLTPSHDLKDRVLNAVNELQKEIES
jgi:intergrase/recombinase